MRLAPFVPAVALLCATGCATPYAYRFEASPPSDGSDDVETRVEVDPAGAKAVTLHVTNKTDEPLQVSWAKISIAGPDGKLVALRPDADLGWLEPGASQTAKLGPFTLPTAGDPALAYDGQHFELRVPMIVRREPKLVRCPLAVHVEPIPSGAP